MRLVQSGGCDLHCHSVRSDGKRKLEELVAMAKERGLRALAITDHNLFDPEFEQEKKKWNSDSFKLINGVEFTATYTTRNGRVIETHIVALMFDSSNPAFIRLLDQYSSGRYNYINAILASLREKQVVDISYEELRNRFPDTWAPGKVHIAQLMAERGVVSNVYEGLDIYVGNLGEKRCWVPQADYVKLPTVKEVVQLIKEAHGIPVLAHPFYYNSLDLTELEELMEDFKEIAGEYGAMEVYYKNYTDEQTKLLEQLSVKYGLVPSCGGDFHGFSETDQLYNFDYEILENLEKLQARSMVG